MQPTPMSQSEARAKARALNAASLHIAAAVPLGCWGGTETGWDVFSATQAQQDPPKETGHLR